MDVNTLKAELYPHNDNLLQILVLESGNKTKQKRTKKHVCMIALYVHIIVFAKKGKQK